MLRLALYQPDIPQNTGTLLRMAACLGLAVEIIEPAGFDVSDRHLRRSGLDYLDHVALTRHRSWDAFDDWRRAERSASSSPLRRAPCPTRISPSGTATAC